MISVLSSDFTIYIFSAPLLEISDGEGKTRTQHRTLARVKLVKWVSGKIV